MLINMVLLMETHVTSGLMGHLFFFFLPLIPFLYLFFISLFSPYFFCSSHIKIRLNQILCCWVYIRFKISFPSISIELFAHGESFLINQINIFTNNIESQHEINFYFLEWFAINVRSISNQFAKQNKKKRKTKNKQTNKFRVK